MNTLFRKLKAHFIPHQENDFKPHFFATTSVLFFSAVIVIVFLLSVLQYSAISSGNNFLASVVSSTLVDITNQERATYNKGSLTVSPVLVQAAQAKANDMASKSYFAHTSPEGVTPWHWFEQAGYTFSYAGENLAVNFSDSVSVGEAWMNSPEHRANILNDNFTEIGIATSQGMYEGVPTTFVVQLFGRPAAISVAENGDAIVKKEKTEIPTATTTTGGAEVAGASLETIAVNDMFIAVKNTAATGSLSVAPENVSKMSFISRLFASPQTALAYTYIVFGALIVIALTLDTFIEIRRRHPVHMLYALLLWILIIALLYVGGTYIFPRVIIV